MRKRSKGTTVIKLIFRMTLTGAKAKKTFKKEEFHLDRIFINFQPSSSFDCLHSGGYWKALANRAALVYSWYGRGSVQRSNSRE